jgi:hypothetical protein
MTVAPAPRGLDLDALIDEARRRARLRRMALAAAALAVAGLGIGAFALTGGSDSPVPAPPGFTAVKATGPVAHALIESTTNVRITSTTGQDRPVKMAQEVWYDARGGLWRVVVRVDGRVRSDRAGTCPVSPGSEDLSCGSAQPLSDLRPFRSLAAYRTTGTGTFRGQPVVWLEPKFLGTRPTKFISQIGLNARTHVLLVQRDSVRGGRVFDETTVTQKPTLHAGSFFFLVRKHAARGIPQDALYERLAGHLLAYGFPAARSALGRTPLWVGPRFGGFALRSVQSGTYPFGTTKIGALRKAPFVRFYYGTRVDEDYRFSVEEFGSTRPYFFKQGPRPGQVERDVYGPAILRLTRGGLIVRVSGTYLPTRKHAIALAKALRPLPSGLKDLPTLRQR